MNVQNTQYIHKTYIQKIFTNVIASQIRMYTIGILLQIECRMLKIRQL